MRNRYFCKIEVDGLWFGEAWAHSVNVRDIAETIYQGWVEKTLYRTVQLWRKTPDGDEVMLKEHINEAALFVGHIQEFTRRCACLDERRKIS
jgi:hypothetical protein